MSVENNLSIKYGTLGSIPSIALLNRGMYRGVMLPDIWRKKSRDEKSIEVVEILRDCELFSRLDEEEIRSVADLGTIEYYEAGDAIYHQGDLEKKLYIVSEGQVHLDRTFNLYENRKANVSVYILRRGWVIGCLCSLVGQAHVQMCPAFCGKPTKVVSINCSDLRELISKDSSLGLKILEKLILTMLRERLETYYGAMEAL